MKKDFSLSNDKAMINFTAKYCDSPEKLLDSNGFRRVLETYFGGIKKRYSNVYKYLEENIEETEETKIVEEITKVFKFLAILKAEEIIDLNIKYEKLLLDKDRFVNFIEDFYGYWRRLERYTLVHNTRINEGFESESFIDGNSAFSNLILNVYRKVEENVLGYKPKVYRQLPAGGNAGLIVNNIRWLCPEQYECLKEIPFIDSVLIDPPFISYPKKNTRDGVFAEVFENPLKDCYINCDHWFCYPAKVGTLLAYIYFHRDFMAHGVTLCNLFEMAKLSEYEDKKPDIVYVYGAKDNYDEVKTVFYDDTKNDIMMGYVSYDESIDYFGYMKKMTLTLHNLIMIKRGNLPIHGAMVNIIMKSGKTANVVIMGDSGAGKSESIEALRLLSGDYISDMTIIFDDMGLLKLNGDDKPLAYGTEIGAFVRLDDLDPGYAFKEIDRSIFMNPDKINARLVIPITPYKDIIRGYPIDMFLYANNYDEVSGDRKEIDFFETPEAAKEVFRQGARMAKGTTTEVGLVKSFFANPFGPVQKKEETNKLLDAYFEKLFSSGVRVGQIRTQLGISGKEKTGPREAALRLFKEIKEL